MPRTLHALTLVIALAIPTPSRAGPRTDFRHDLQRRALAYFLDNTHPVSGLTRDRARNFEPTPDTGAYRVASIAATGFALATFAHASSIDLLPREEAVRRVLAGLDTVVHRLEARHGWLYHFVDWETGRRAWRSEVSTIDTTWLVAGALYAAAKLEDPRVTALADELWRRLDFEDVRTNGGSKPDKLTVSMGWKPETGYLAWDWGSYAEQLLLLILGLGHPATPLPAASWDAVARPVTDTPDGPVIAADLPLFVHQYSHAFVDLRGCRDRHADYFQNSVLATRANRRASEQRAGRSRTYREGFWGLSASDGPDGYAAHSPAHENGTVCPGCAVASDMFSAGSVVAEAHRWASGPYGPRIWGRYGFADAFNLDRGWFGGDALGITVGALYLALANGAEDTSVWRDFTALSPVRRGLERAGLRCGSPLPPVDGPR